MTERRDEPARVGDDQREWLVSAMNPHVDFFDSHHWGYSVVEFTPEDCTDVGYVVAETVDSADTERILVACRIPEGEHELEEITDEYRP